MLYFLFLILIKHDCQTVKYLNVFAMALYLATFNGKKYKKYPYMTGQKPPWCDVMWAKISREVERERVAVVW